MNSTFSDAKKKKFYISQPVFKKICSPRIYLFKLNMSSMLGKQDFLKTNHWNAAVKYCTKNIQTFSIHSNKQD